MSPELHSITGNKNKSLSTVESLKATSLVDDTFDPNKSDSYHLSIEVSNWDVSFCVLDTLANKYLVLHTEEIGTAGDFVGIDHLLKMVQTQELLRPKYKSTSLLLVDDKFTTVPGPFYEKTRDSSFLNFNIEGLVGEHSSHEVLSDNLQGTEAVSVYPIQKAQHADLTSVFGNLKILHHTSSLIETLLSKAKNQNKKTCFLHLQRGIFTLLVIEGNDLRYCNNFRYASKEDLAYYTLFVCEQLQLNPETLKMVLLGEIGVESPEYEILYEYIRNLTFIDRNNNFSYSYKLDSLPGQYHYNLFSQFHCVS